MRNRRRIHINARLRDEPDLDALVVAVLVLADELNDQDVQPAHDEAPLPPVVGEADA